MLQGYMCIRECQALLSQRDAGETPYTATHDNPRELTATHCNTLQHTVTHRDTLQHTATHKCREVSLHDNTLQHTATHCTTLHHAATRSNTLKHTATHCNTLDQTRIAKGEVTVSLLFAARAKGGGQHSCWDRTTS